MKIRAKKLHFTKITVSKLSRGKMAYIKGASVLPPCGGERATQDNDDPDCRGSERGC